MRKAAAIFRQGLARAGLSGEQVRSCLVGEHLISWGYFEVGCFLWPNKSLEPTATVPSVLTMIARLNIIIPDEARLPWLWLSSGR